MLKGTLGFLGAATVCLSGLWIDRALGQTPVRRATPTANAAQPASRHRLVPLAETRLLMEGLTNANFLGLEKLLRADELDPEAWGFARGQALLIAESGNLLLLRAPRDARQEPWMKLAGEMRDSAGQLARWVQRRDLAQSRTAMSELAGRCNACHQAFEAGVRIQAFQQDRSGTDE